MERCGLRGEGPCSLIRAEPSYMKVIDVREGKDLHFPKMAMHLVAVVVVAHWLGVVDGLNASKASLTDRTVLQQIVGVIPESGLVVVLRQEFQLARQACQLQRSSFEDQVESFEAAPSLVCRPKWV